MPFRHPIVGSVFAVTRILSDVVRTDHPLTSKSGPEHICISRHRESRECFPRDAGKRVQRIRLALFIHEIVKKRAELRSHYLGGDIGDGLHQLFEIELGGKHRDDSIQELGDFARLTLVRQ